MKRLSWISRVGLTYNHMYSYKRKVEGDLTHTAEKEMWRLRREKFEDAGVIQPQAKEFRMVEEARNGFSPRASRQSKAMPPL